MIPPQPSQVRFKVDAGDVPPEKAARRMHLNLAQFRELLPRLYMRGFLGQIRTLVTSTSRLSIAGGGFGEP
jgi:hypothetical protein